MAEGGSGRFAYPGMARQGGELDPYAGVGETLGQTLIPAINKLQDVFAQVGPGPTACDL